MSHPLKPAKRMLLALPFVLLTATGQAQEQQENQNRSQWDSHWSSGKDLYEKVCAHCHAPEVSVGPLIEGRELAPAYVQFIVRNGFNAMPSFPASYIDDESIAMVAEYLSSLPAPTNQPEAQP